jgi:pimeloyl-ACP methyl ester carboxylesterase
MSYANNKGVRICYEVEGEGPPLVLSHGFFSTLETWRESGYTEGLKNDYRLILVDSRGHGRSDRPHNPQAYTTENRVSDITVILDDLDIKSTNFLGYSIGGRAGLKLAKLAPNRVLSVIIGGTGPSGMNSDNRNQLIELLKAGPQAMVASIENQSGLMHPGVKARLLDTDFDALIASAKATYPDLTLDLPSMTMPFLVYFGESDPSIEFKKLFTNLPDATSFSLPGLNHAQAFARSDLVLPHIKEFLSRVIEK